MKIIAIIISSASSSDPGKGFVLLLNTFAANTTTIYLCGRKALITRHHLAMVQE
jgi:hypothetical protein